MGHRSGTLSALRSAGNQNKQEDIYCHFSPCDQAHFSEAGTCCVLGPIKTCV